MHLYPPSSVPTNLFPETSASVMDFQLLSDGILETRLGLERHVFRLLGRMTVPKFRDQQL